MSFLKPKLERSRLFDVVVIKSWWLLCIFFVCFCAFEQAARKREKEITHLKEKLTELEKERDVALVLQEELSSKIKSFDDPAYIEMTLMKGLGLTPEGQVKVVFSSK